uniref:Uncharacterized protein n=1 Tax=Strigamia maritima TaxID=126957 RepID=T1JKC8_STRMM
MFFRVTISSVLFLINEIILFLFFFKIYFQNKYKKIMNKNTIQFNRKYNNTNKIYLKLLHERT